MKGNAQASAFAPLPSLPPNERGERRPGAVERGDPAELAGGRLGEQQVSAVDRSGRSVVDAPALSRPSWLGRDGRSILLGDVHTDDVQLDTPGRGCGR